MYNITQTILAELKHIPLLEIDKPTKATGMIYPYDIVKKAIESPVIQEKILNKAFFGCSAPSPNNPGLIDAMDISHSITKLELTEDCLYGDIAVLDTPTGRVLNKHLNSATFHLWGEGYEYPNKSPYAEDAVWKVGDLEIITFYFRAGE